MNPPKIAASVAAVFILFLFASWIKLTVYQPFLVEQLKLVHYKNHSVNFSLICPTLTHIQSQSKFAMEVQNLMARQPKFRYHPRLNLHSSDNCTSAKYSSTPLPLTALVSLPGSGNTWTRHVIELTTGLYTGAVYFDSTLRTHFPAEGIRDNRTVAIKIHERWGHWRNQDWKRVVLIVRNQKDALVANYKRTRAPNKESAHVENVGNINITDWNKYSKWYQKKNLGFNSQWISVAMKRGLDLFILSFDDLLNDYANTVARLAKFFGAQISPQRMKCIESNKEGFYHRNQEKESTDVFLNVPINKTLIEEDNKLFKASLLDCLHKQKCALSGCGVFSFLNGTRNL